MAISDMNHFTVLTHDLDATRQFYIGILGLKEGYRPDLGFPGAWLYIGERAVLHVIAGRPEVLDALRERGFRSGLTPARPSLGRMHTLLPILQEAFSAPQ